MPESPTIDSRSVAGRRRLQFHSLDEMLADAEALVASTGTRTLGNWPLDKLLMHLAVAMNGSIDGIDVRAPWFVRALGPAIKRRVMKSGMRPGFNLPKEREPQAFPPGSSAHEALDCLRAAVARVRAERMISPHPVFGAMTHDEWLKLHLRHAEMHLSFAVPGEAGGERSA